MFVRAVAVSKTVVCAIKRTSLSLIMLSPCLVSAHSDGRGLAVSEWLVAPTLPPPTFTIGCRAVAGVQWWPGRAPGAGWGWSPGSFPAHYPRSRAQPQVHTRPLSPGSGGRGHWSHPGIIGRTGDNRQTLLIATGFSGSHLIIKAARLEIRRQTNYQIALYNL